MERAVRTGSTQADRSPDAVAVTYQGVNEAPSVDVSIAHRARDLGNKWASLASYRGFRESLYVFVQEANRHMSRSRMRLGGGAKASIAHAANAKLFSIRNMAWKWAVVALPRPGADATHGDNIEQVSNGERAQHPHVPTTACHGKSDKGEGLETRARCLGRGIRMLPEAFGASKIRARSPGCPGKHIR